MSDEIRADQVRSGMVIREYGLDTTVRVIETAMHGDTVLITAGNQDEFSLDRDEVVEDCSRSPVRMEGTVTLANGEVVSFSIGDVAGSITYMQWGNVPEQLYGSVPLMDAIVKAIHEEETVMVVPQ